MGHDSNFIVGVDLGNKNSHICRLNTKTGEIEHSKVQMTRKAARLRFSDMDARRVVMEVGGHSRWFSQLLRDLGFEVIVADARRIALISKSLSKNDKNDALMLARLGASDLELLHPVHHRGDEAQKDLALIKIRDTLVRVRTQLINTVRGTVKPFGLNLGAWSSKAFVKRASEEIPEDLVPAVIPLFETIDEVSKQILHYDQQIQQACEKKYPETKALTQVRGVGSLTALAFVLTLETPKRFTNSRAVGSYLGLRPRQADSGKIVKQLGITKAGNGLLRRLVVHCAQYMLGPFGEDCDLKRWGHTLAERGGKNAKKRATVAVARKLSVLLHRLWLTQDEYEPLRNATTQQAVA